MESAVHRIPALQHTGLKKLYNGPESFTPDNQFILGEAPELRGFFVGAGFNSVGIASGGGAGRALAEWIVEGEPTSDLVAVDIRRFAPFNANNRWLRDRVGEVLGLHYAVPVAQPGAGDGPSLPPVAAPPPAGRPRGGLRFEDGMGAAQRLRPDRAARRARLHLGPARLAGLVGGGAGRDPASAWPSSTRRPSASSWWSAGTPRRCSSACARPTWRSSRGRAVYTGMLNDRAGYEADVTVTRLAARPVPARDQRRLAGARRGAGSSATSGPASTSRVVDVSSAYAVLGVMGPASRQLLGRLGSADLSDEAFPFSTSREIALGYATVRATRITYVGELGWELYVPTEFAVGVYEDLVAAGADLGLVDAGYYAINSLRLDKGYRAFGSDLTPDYTPLEAGLRFTCKLDDLHRLRGPARPWSRPLRPGPDGASSPSGSATPTPCSGAASWSCTTARRPAR